MIRVLKTNSENQDFIELVKFLDLYLAEKDGDDHSFYNQFNKIDRIKHVVIIYDKGKAIACGAIKEYKQYIMEIKRMYTAPECRGKGIATKILIELENWSAEMSYEKCLLETGVKQEEAIGLYKKNGYKLISNYGQYIGVKNSLCFEKQLN